MANCIRTTRRRQIPRSGWDFSWFDACGEACIVVKDPYRATGKCEYKYSMASDVCGLVYTDRDVCHELWECTWDLWCYQEEP